MHNKIVGINLTDDVGGMMKNKFLVLLCLPLNLLAQYSPQGTSGEWVFVSELSDEFNEAEINKMRWNYNPSDWGVWSWEPENAFIKDSALHLQMVQETHERNNSEYYYKSGIVRSLSAMTYGYYEARIKGCERFPGAAPAFWLYSMGGNNLNNVTYSEIDIIEIQQNEWHNGAHTPVEQIDMNLHTRELINGEEVWRRPGSWPEVCRHYWTAPWDPRDDYHIYACEVRPDSIFWIIDGVQRAEEKNHNWHLPMYLTLSMGLRYPFVKYVNGERLPVPEKTTKTGFPTRMKIDWVRTYKPVSPLNKEGIENSIKNSGFEEFLTTDIGGSYDKSVGSTGNYYWQGIAKTAFELSAAYANTGYRSMKVKYSVYGTPKPAFYYSKYPSLTEGRYALSFYYKIPEHMDGMNMLVYYEDGKYRRSNTLQIDTISLKYQEGDTFVKAELAINLEEAVTSFHPKFEFPDWENGMEVYFDDFQLKSELPNSTAVNESSCSAQLINQNHATNFLLVSEHAGLHNVNVFSMEGKLVNSSTGILNGERFKIVEKQGVYFALIINGDQVVGRQKVLIR